MLLGDRYKTLYLFLYKNKEPLTLTRRTDLVTGGGADSCHNPELQERKDGHERDRLDADDHVVMRLVALVNHNRRDIVADTCHVQDVRCDIQQNLETKVLIEPVADHKQLAVTFHHGLECVNNGRSLVERDDECCPLAWQNLVGESDDVSKSLRTQLSYTLQLVVYESVILSADQCEQQEVAQS